MTRTNWLWMSLMLAGCLEAPTAAPADLTDMPPEVPADTSGDLSSDASEDMPPDTPDIPIGTPDACQTDGDTFTVSTAEEFKCIATHHAGKDHTFLVLNDIDFKGVEIPDLGSCSWNEASYACDGDASPFIGTLEGVQDGVSLTNLMLPPNPGGLAGLFGHAAGATFKRLEVRVSLEEVSRVEQAPHIAGGLVGIGHDLTLESVHVVVSGLKAKHVAGGVIGRLSGESTINDVHVQGDVLVYGEDLEESNAYAGGAVAMLGAAADLSVTNLNVSMLQVTNENASALSTAAGGVVGTATRVAKLRFAGEISMPQLVQGDKHVGGWIGFAKLTPLDLSNATLLAENSPNISGGSSVGGLIGALFEDVNSTVPNVLNMGNVEVRGHLNVGGVVGFLKDAAISDLTLDEVMVIGVEKDDQTPQNTGGMIGLVLSTSNPISLKEFHAQRQVTVKGHRAVGGLIGLVSNSVSLQDSSSSASLDAEKMVGGLIGRVNGDVSNKVTLRNVASDANIQHLTYATAPSNIGGLVGSLDHATLSHSQAKTAMPSAAPETTLIGGLVGHATNSTIQTSSVEADMTLNAITGNSSVGGLVGRAQDSTIQNCYVTRDVTGATDIGGLVGRASATTITNAYAQNSVNTFSNTGTSSGGVLGFAESQVTITSCYYEGRLGNDDAGAIQGNRADLGVRSSRYDVLEGAQPCYGGLTGPIADNLNCSAATSVRGGNFVQEPFFWSNMIWDTLNPNALPTLKPPNEIGK